MPSCLGLYIENNLIKYAKVSKSGETVKVEAFGVKFYENFTAAIKQIVEETYSFKLPIIINTTEEWYNDIRVFSLLSKPDMDKVIKTEFENICYENETNEKIYEQRYVFSSAPDSEDRLKVIHVSVPKTSIEQRKNQFADHKISGIIPLSLSIPNLVKKEKKGASLVVNIENKTTITKILNGMVADVHVIDAGSEEILNQINKKENSYSKSYEICKSATIYTETDKDLQYEENEYLEDIMPTLFQIVSQVKKVVSESLENIEKIYITGTGAIINNVDIYFQDYIKSAQCEILRPSFVSNNSKVNIKDYIEVNSAISIALQVLEKNDRGINFKNESNTDKLKKALTSNISDLGELELTKNVLDFFGRANKQFSVMSITALLLIGMYFGGTLLLEQQLNNRIAEADKSINDTNSRIKKVKEYNKKIVSQTDEYKDLIRRIQDINDANSEDRRYKNTIPNLLNKIMVVIPRNVQLISIENTTDTHVIIKAKSEEFQQIAYFKTKLATEGILENVVSDTGTSQGGFLSVTIEGELP